MHRLKAGLGLFVIAALFACAPASTSGPGLGQTKDIYEEAFIYGFPLVVNYSVMYQYAIDKTSSQYKAPFNHLYSSAQVYTYKDTAVVTPNSDTPYSTVFADLRAEPLVLCMPAIDKDRYYSVQLVDMYTFNYGYIGSRATGNGAGCYLVAGPAWKGAAPLGVLKVFHCETPFSAAIYRTQLFGPNDVANVKAIQAGYKVLTLSAYLHKPAPPPAPAMQWPKYSKSMFTTDFPATLSFLLRFLPATGPAAGEKPLRDRFASVGIIPTSDFKPSLSLAQKAMMLVAAKEGLNKINAAVDALGVNQGGWQIGSAAGDRAFYNGDWLLRAVGAKAGIYGNSAAEAVYLLARKDADGDLIDAGQHNYAFTFKRNQLPPVRAFWSITMYDGKTQLLIKNPINRYLVNSPMLPALKKNSDGSLTVYVQKNSPGGDKAANWLPAPDGDVFMVMRLYWPQTTPPSVLPLGKGSWQPPPIIKTS